MSLNFQAMEFSFAKGLNQKVDPRLIQAPELVRAVDVDFDNLGGLRLRKPYASIGANIFGGGTISNCRRIVSNGDELLLFTKDSLYSWSSQRSAWINKATHLAIKVDERPAFINTDDQVDCDRAELSGTIVYAWTKNTSGSSNTGTVYAAAVDKTTGAVLTAPTAMGGASRPRLVALSTKILLLSVTSGGGLISEVIDPASPTLTGLSTSTVVASGTHNSYFDVVKAPGADTAVFAGRRAVTTSYTVGTITSANVVSTSTKARTCTDAIAVSCAATGVVQIIRGNSTDVQGDLLTSALVDSTTGQAIGTATGAVSKIAAAHRSTQDSSAYRCYAFWSADESDAGTSTFRTKYNYVDTAGTIGTEADFVIRLGVASRAFDYDGRVFVALVFGGLSAVDAGTGLTETGALQNTFFVYRDDATLHAKVAGGRAIGLTSSPGHLPGVALTDGTTSYSWCCTERRIVPLTGGFGYSDRGPRDVTLTFDSNDARRCARLGQTLYVTGGELLQYDGVGLFEVGFHVYPWYFALSELASGSIATNGSYAVKGSMRWDSARGERERSTTASIGLATIASQPGGIQIANGVPLHVTHKTSNPPAVEFWRTPVSPSDSSLFYLVTSEDPSASTNPQRYVANAPTSNVISTVEDALSDADLAKRQTHPENGGVIENICPPPASMVAASAVRLFIAGVPAEPNRVFYSKLRDEGEIAAFNEALAVSIPATGGALTALAFLNETLVVFRESAIYALDGIGFDNIGGGQNYEARLVSADVGAVSHEAVALTPAGLVFKSSKGWYLLNRGWSASYVGAGVRNYDSESVYAAHVVESEHQVRIVTSGRALVWDYLADAWFEWTITDGLHACVYGGTYHYLATASVKSQQNDWSTADYAMDVEMLIHLGQLQGFSRVQEVLVLGEYRSSHTLRVRAGSFTENSYFDDKTWTPSPTTVGGALQFRHGPSQQQHAAIRIRLTSSTTTGEKLRLSALSLKVGFKAPTYRHLPAAQKQ